MPREINLSRLDAAQRKIWWERIKNEAPALAELLQNETFIDLKTRFGGQVIIKIDNSGNIINGNN